MQLWDFDDLRELGERAGCRKPRTANICCEHWNEPLEIFARFECVGGGGSVHYSRETGFTLMRDVLQELGFPDRFPSPIDFNDRGQILLSIYNGEKRVGVLLTPVD